MELQCRSIVILGEKSFLVPGDFTQRLHILARGAPFGIFQEKRSFESNEMKKRWEKKLFSNE